MARQDVCKDIDSIGLQLNCIWGSGSVNKKSTAIFWQLTKFSRKICMKKLAAFLHANFGPENSCFSCLFLSLSTSLSLDSNYIAAGSFHMIYSITLSAASYYPYHLSIRIDSLRLTRVRHAFPSFRFQPELELPCIPLPLSPFYFQLHFIPRICLT